jgi:hypothetical protein
MDHGLFEYRAREQIEGTLLDNAEQPAQLGRAATLDERPGRNVFE